MIHKGKACGDGEENRYVWKEKELLGLLVWELPGSLFASAGLRCQAQPTSGTH
jgi:hypothetical protein